MSTSLFLSNKMDKRERGPNFSETEKEKFLQICYKYKTIIENKKSDSATVSQRTKAWFTITEEYNCQQTTGIRDPKNLKILYDNLKMKARKEKHDNKVLQLNKALSGSFVEITIPSNTIQENLTKYEKKRKISEVHNQVNDVSSNTSTEEAKKLEFIHEEHLKKMKILQIDEENAQLQTEILKVKLENELKKGRLLEAQLKLNSLLRTMSYN